MINEDINVVIREAKDYYYFRQAKTIIEALKEIPIYYKRKNNVIGSISYGDVIIGSISYTDSECYYDIANKSIITTFHGEKADTLKLEDFCKTWGFRKGDIQ
jgi:hypothetical protein